MGASLPPPVLAQAKKECSKSVPFYAADTAARTKKSGATQGAAPLGAYRDLNRV
jgi:hypothetical protein